MALPIHICPRSEVDITPFVLPTDLEYDVFYYSRKKKKETKKVILKQMNKSRARLGLKKIKKYTIVRNSWRNKQK